MLTKFAMKRPVAIIVSLIALVVFGFSSLMGTPLELYPTMSMPMLMIMTSYQAGPEEVEELVTTKIEAAVGNLAGLKTVQSISAENNSTVMIELEYGTNLDRANSDVQKKINMVKAGLPKEASDPLIIEMAMDSTSVMEMSVLPKADVDLLTYSKENLVPEFEKISGVASVSTAGGGENYLSIRLIPERMRQYGLDIQAVSSAVSAADFSLPAGSLEQGGLQLNLRGGVSYPTSQQLATLPLTLRSGDVIHLSDIANVGFAEYDATTISRQDGEERVYIGVTKRNSASTNGVTNAVQKTVDRINSTNSTVELDITYNASETIWESLLGVIQAMALAIVISMVILYLFLGDIRASLIVGTSMPISLLVTLIAMAASGMTFNMLSLGGLTIGVGMMVDNSIVVLDSCFKRRDARRSFYDAAVEGAQLVAGAVAASTTTTVVVFLPIALMKGMSGQMFKDAGFTIVFALLASLISALTLVPMLFVKFTPKERQSNPLAKGMRRLEQHYARLVRYLLDRKAMVVTVAVVMLVGSFAMLPAIGMELMPSSDDGSISITVGTRPGQKLAGIEKIMNQVEAAVVKIPDLDSYSIYASASASAYSTGSSGNSSVTVKLKKDRTSKTADIVNQLRKETAGILNADIKVTMGGGMQMSGGGTDTVQSYYSGNDREKLLKATEEIKAVMEGVEGVVSVATSFSDGAPQAEIFVDPVRAGAVGLTPRQVIASVGTTVSGTEATTIRMDGRDYSVRVEYPEETYQSIADLSELMLTSGTGIQVPLLDIARVEYSNSPQQVMKYNNQFVATVTAQTLSQNAAKISRDVTTAVSGYTLPDGVSQFFGGSIETMNEELMAILGALGTAIFLVFMVMAIQFNSIGFSLMVMISVPFSLIGAFLGLLLTNCSINMTSMMGGVLLVGIVVNNAIVLIDYTGQLQEQGMMVKNALIKAGRTRLRPILMTTLTTILGMVPLAIGMGSNAEMMRGMAMVVIGGLTTSTLLTLILIPTFYLMFSKKDAKNPNLKHDDNFDPEHPEVEYTNLLPSDSVHADPTAVV